MRRETRQIAWLGMVGLLALSSQSAAGEAALPPACVTECSHAYGAVLGKSPSSVEAYSNCRPDCVVYTPHRHQGTYTGIRWQCVEYARRWLLVNRGAVYGDVDVAADIWDKIDHLSTVPDGKTLPLEAYLNGAGSRPQRGDLLIYARAFHGTGHVAVVTAVDEDRAVIMVGEQNFLNRPWEGDHARTIPYHQQDGGYWLLDPYLIGWKRIAEP